MKSLNRAATAAMVSAALVLAVGSGLLLGAVPAGAATVTSAGPAHGQARTATASVQDTGWAQATAQTDLAEIAIGQLAQQRAAHSATKMMAQVTISDHTKALASLKSVASQEGITLPGAPNATQQAQAAQLKAVASSQFDATYDSIQIQGHELSISQTRTELADGVQQCGHGQRQCLSAGGGEAPADGRERLHRPRRLGVQRARRERWHRRSGRDPARRDPPWLAAGAIGAILLVGTGTFAVRNRVRNPRLS